MALIANVVWALKPTRLSHIATMILLNFMMLAPAFAIQPQQKSVGFCNSLFPHLFKLFPTHTIKMPVDHFHNETRYEPHSDKYFNNRFWFDDTYYKPGGPVIVENAGEITGGWHLNDLQIGLLHELAKATNGIAVVLEHRYYGHSLPVLVRNVEAFRFLTVEQAMADQAYFAQNVVFPGKEHLNLTAPNTPWFAIGCSYPGALTAFERIQYPDLFWGAISSSGTTVSTIDYWEYWNVVREYSPQDCSTTFGKLINIFDNILLGGNASQIAYLKNFFGWNATNVQFAAGEGFGYNLQTHSWLPCLDSESNRSFCPHLTASTVLFPEAKKSASKAKTIIADGGWANETESLTIALLNYLGYSRDFKTGSPAESLFESDELESSGFELKLFAYQYQICTELGAFLTGDQPPHPLPIISSLITLDYAMKPCREGYIPGAGLNLTGFPDTERLNKYGGYNISYPRLMLVGGEADPWRPLTPLASRDTPTRLNYPSTPEQPWYVIPGGTHCWDYPGVFESQKKAGIPPDSIKHVHNMEKDAFQRWLKEWHDCHPNYNPYVQQ